MFQHYRLQKHGTSWLLVTILTLAHLTAYSRSAWQVNFAGGIASAQKLREEASFHDTYYDNIDSGYNLSASIERQLTNKFRVEGEILYIHQSINQFAIDNIFRSAHGHISATPVLVNFYRDFPLDDVALIPFVGIGVGGVHLDKDIQQDAGSGLIKGTDTVFAYQLSTGVHYILDKHWQIGMGYHYLATARSQFPISNSTGTLGSLTSVYKVHLINADISYSIFSP